MDPNQPPTQQPLQTPPEVFDIQPKPNYLKTIIFSVLIVFTLGLIVYLFFQNQKLQKQVLNPPVSPTIQVPSPTSKAVSSISIDADIINGWKIYKSTKLGLSFEYPPEYKVPEESNNYISLISPLNPEPNKGYELQNGELKIEIYVSNATSNETLSDLIKKKKDQSGNILKEEEILINGITAVKQTWEGGAGSGQTILFVNNNKEFGIMKYPAATTRDNEFDQILSTFKFIDDGSVCVPTYQVETNSVELTAEQNYSVRCTEQRSEKDCFSIDLYNQKADDFSIPDGIPDCIWKNPINTI